MLSNTKKTSNMLDNTPRPAEPYIGCKVSLISMLDIRYEGTLYTLNTEEKTLTLAQVRSYGTEDRQAPCAVEPAENVYQYVVFKAANVKDLFVVEDSSSKDIGMDPAIVTYKPAFNPSDSPQRRDNGGEGRRYNNGGNFGGRNGGGSGGGHHFGGHNGGRGLFNGSGGGGDRRFNRDYSFNNHRNGMQPPQMLKTGMFSNKNRNASNLHMFASDYDFAKANEMFKEKFEVVEDGEEKSDHDSSADSKQVAGEGEKSPTKEEKSPAYNKASSFFDNISCETVEKMEGKFRPRDWQTERNLNQQTFGFHGGFHPPSGRMNGGGGGGYRMHQQNNYNNGGGSFYKGNKMRI
ncbi:FFD and TFG box motif protein [Aphelenchoides fujianensis]|nr:FFD and TFG box motif protein [Aphelenchoides fujianensis]